MDQIIDACSVVDVDAVAAAACDNVDADNNVVSISAIMYVISVLNLETCEL